MSDKRELVPRGFNLVREHIAWLSSLNWISDGSYFSDWSRLSQAGFEEGIVPTFGLKNSLDFEMNSLNSTLL
jgi:hypothetical protein